MQRDSRRTESARTGDEGGWTYEYGWIFKIGFERGVHGKCQEQMGEQCKIPMRERYAKMGFVCEGMLDQESRVSRA